MMEHLLNYRNYEKRIVYLQTTLTVFPERADQIKVELEELEELQARLREAVNSFSEPLKQVLEFKYFEDLTLESIAREIGYTHNYIRTVHSSFTRAAKELEPYIKY